MPDYKRFFVPGGTYFFTIVTHERQPLFATEANVEKLRVAMREVQQEMPFEILAAVILPDHMHFLWSLPRGDTGYSKRIGLMKVKFTRSIRSKDAVPFSSTQSRLKHRESDVWQRRFWEHTIRDEDDFERHFDYIHYNPVKHGLTTCPHLWPYSSFHRWVTAGVCESRWACRCDDRHFKRPDFSTIAKTVGE